MENTRGATTVVAAQAGDPRAQDELVAEYLPLVYNVVGRALNGHPDVDDVVQETMLHMIDGLAGLRDPACFRSWLVAIAMNQVRRNWQFRQLGSTGGGLDDALDVADPGADFVDLTIVRLGLSGQRRQVAEATRWLDADDRALLSLWWLEAAGELTRAEVATALELSPQHAAVRIQRMKAQLETARVVVRALWAVPRCAELALVTAAWDGAPSALWRKRIARHTRECAACCGQWTDLVPAEGLLVGCALLPLPASLAAGGGAIAPTLGTATGHGTTPGHGAGSHGAGHTAGGHGAGAHGAEHTAAGHGTGGHPVTGHTMGHAPGSHPATGHSIAGHTAGTHGAGHTATGHTPATPNLGHGGGPVPAGTHSAAGPTRPAAGHSADAPRRQTGRHGRRRFGRRPRAAGAVAAAVLAGALYFTVMPDDPAPAAPVAAARTTPRPAVSVSPSVRPTPTPRPTRTATPPTHRPVAPRPRPRPTAAPPPTVQQQVLNLLNSARGQHGCAPLRKNTALQTAAQRQSDDMSARHFFDHTNPDGAGPGDRITAAGYQWSAYAENIAYGQQSPAQVMDEWMNSPGHRANILNCSLQEVGIGVNYGPGGPWWTQDFGTRL
ncbi:sigma-70 family RNA polymerase sigma factor [Streptomyces sp. NPDC020096]